MTLTVSSVVRTDNPQKPTHHSRGRPRGWNRSFWLWLWVSFCCRNQYLHDEDHKLFHGMEVGGLPGHDMLYPPRKLPA
jgi:hypothetical protein